MKQKPIITAALLAVLSILNTGGTVSAASYELSPALELISQDIVMSKCTVSSSEVKFTREDFENTLNSPLGYVTVASLPSAEIGVLKYAGSGVYEGQTIPCSNLGLLKFTPSRNTGSTSFSFYADGNDGLTASCTVTVLDKHNGTPVAGDVSVNAISGIPVSGTLDILDPDGDGTTVKISGYPEKGIVKLSGNSFVYTSVPNFCGKDSFSYTVCDSFGSVSEKATVTLSVEKTGTDVRYDDMNGHWGYTGALKMTELGLMSGRNDGGKTVFSPDTPVTRGDFLAMAMICAGLEEKIRPGTVTTFADDSSIPSNIRSYASYAQAGGIINGYRDAVGNSVFESSAGITRAEAAAVLSNIIGKHGSVGEFSFNDANTVPEWARESFASLAALGIIKGDTNGNLCPQRELTRAEAAQILCNLYGMRVS